MVKSRSYKLCGWQMFVTPREVVRHIACGFGEIAVMVSETQAVRQLPPAKNLLAPKIHHCVIVISRLLVLLFLSCHMGQMCDGATRLNKVDFHRDIRPILVENCFQCHGPDEVARKGNLRLDLPEGTQAVITPGQPDASKLMQRVTARDPSKRMPPTSFGQRLSDSEQQKLALWIEQGPQVAS